MHPLQCIDAYLHIFKRGWSPPDIVDILIAEPQFIVNAAARCQGGLGLTACFFDRFWVFWSPLRAAFGAMKGGLVGCGVGCESWDQMLGSKKGSFWDLTWTISGSIHLRITSGSCWHLFGIIWGLVLVSFWPHFDAFFGPFLAIFVPFWVFFARFWTVFTDTLRLFGDASGMSDILGSWMQN